MADLEEHIRDRFAEGTAAWNRGDLDAYLAGYWESEKTRWITRGKVIRGVNAIRAMYKSLFDSPEKMGTFAVQELEIDILTDSDVLVIGQWSHTAGPLVRQGVFTIHMKKLEGGWVVVTDHTSSAM
jgi:uncharacterized protein (TIGR02246 family)